MSATSNLQQQADRRRALPGYPVEPRLLPLDEIRNYFAGDLVVCLRCGKSYRGLAGHLGVHGVTGG